VRRRLAALAELALPFAVVAIVWQAVVGLGLMHPKLFPGLDRVAAAFVRLTASGVLPMHAASTIVRLAAGFALGAVLGVTLGVLMGRFRWAEALLLPLVSVGNPVPGLAYAPLFVIWFGLGNLPAVLLVAFAAAFPVAVNTWTGVRAVKEIWLRAASAMGAGERQIFRQVVVPGALPWMLTGLRLGLARAWRVLVAVEMLTSVSFGLGWLIFGAREFLATDVMLAGIAVIGLVGLGLEKLVFERLERFTIVRWGMVTR
jgi:NitT/TauT family transport system permease protein